MTTFPHILIPVRKTGYHWVTSCTCGWTWSTRISEEVASDLGQKHLKDAEEGPGAFIGDEDGYAEQVKPAVNFIKAMEIVDDGFKTWREKPHNKRWWDKIDGTPIPNDLAVNIAEAIVRHLNDKD